jgi:hypothetical protein
MKFITSNTTRRVTVIRLLGKSEILGSAILNATAISPSTAPEFLVYYYCCYPMTMLSNQFLQLP